MPQIYLKTELYDEIIQRGEQPGKFVNAVVETALHKLAVAGLVKDEPDKEKGRGSR